MKIFLKNIRKKVNNFIWAQALTGVFLLMMAVVIVWVNFALELIVALLLIGIAYAFIYSAYKIWHIKKEVEKFFKIQ